MGHLRVVLILTLMLPLPLIVPTGIAHAQSDFERERDRKPMTDALYEAYRRYGYIKICHKRQHFWATYISDDELAHAKDKILVIETDTLAWLNDFSHKDRNVDTVIAIVSNKKFRWEDNKKGLLAVCAALRPR